MLAGLSAGFALGFCVAAPIGPMAMLCVQRAVAGGMALALPTGLGASTVHAFYAGAASFGITTLSQRLVGSEALFQFAAAALLLWLGVSAMISAAAPTPLQPKTQGRRVRAGAYVSTVALALGNPMTPVLFAGLAPGLVAHAPSVEPIAVMMGAFLGSSTWWFALSGGVCLLRRRMGPQALSRLNALVGSVLVACALAGLGGALTAPSVPSFALR